MPYTNNISTCFRGRWVKGFHSQCISSERKAFPKTDAPSTSGEETEGEESEEDYPQAVQAAT